MQEVEEVIAVEAQGSSSWWLTGTREDDDDAMPTASHGIATVPVEALPASLGATDASAVEGEQAATASDVTTAAAAAAGTQAGAARWRVLPSLVCAIDDATGQVVPVQCISVQDPSVRAVSDSVWGVGGLGEISVPGAHKRSREESEAHEDEPTGTAQVQEQVQVQVWTTTRPVECVVGRGPTTD